MLCTFGCLDVTTDGDDEAALDRGNCTASNRKTAANESLPTSCARALHMRTNAESIVRNRSRRDLRKIDPAYGPIRLTDLN